MILGFTGTRKGMSMAQKHQLQTVLYALRTAKKFHHGGARGADTEADTFVRRTLKICVRPAPGVVAGFGSTGSNGRGQFNGHDVEWRDVLPPLVRNKRIVDACDVLIAAPLRDREELRSGTWATIRHARRMGKPVVMLSRGE